MKESRESVEDAAGAHKKDESKLFINRFSTLSSDFS